MKRALAERAKQSLPDRSPSATTTTTTATTSSPEGQPPLKIARPSPPPPPPLVVSHHSHDQGTTAQPVLGGTTTTTSSSSRGGGGNRTPRSPKPGKTVISAKRPREVVGSGGATPRGSSTAAHHPNGGGDDVDETSAFYLKHQNRALATELKSWQQQCRELSTERDQRRQSCWKAVVALQNLQATWTSLETAMGRQIDGSSTSNTASAAPTPGTTLSLSSEQPPVESTVVTPSTAPRLTTYKFEDNVEQEDPAKAIEWTGALHAALQNLAFPSNNNSTATAVGNVEEGHTDVGDLATNVSTRVSCLQDWMWKVLHAKQVPLEHLKNIQRPPDDAESSFATQCERLQHQLVELTRSRDFWLAQERRLRRNLYRLEAGIVTLPQVMNSLETQSTGEDDLATQDAEIRAVVQLEKDAQTPAKEEKTGDENDAEKVSSTVVDKLHKHIEQLEQEKKRRDENIVELNQQLKTQGERINQLSVKQQSDEDAKRLETLESTLLELGFATTRVSALETEMQDLKERWSVAQGNEAAALASLEELRQNHATRWAELNESDGDTADQVAQLRHKLQQALEHVRQAEEARSNLADALDLNEKLRVRLEEVKAAVPEEQAPTAKEEPTISSSGSGDKVSAEKYDRLHKEYRKVREKLASMAASKESYKGKLERADKERENMNEMNARLLRSMAEKEEVNAKSLSSILHLKSMTDELTAQRDNLEEQAVSANNLATTARATATAKDRVVEELTKGKEEAESQLKETRSQLEAAESELAELKRENSGNSSKHASLSLELSNALKRADELVAEGESKRDEIRRLVDSVDRAEKSAREWKEKVEQLSKASGGGDVSEFTVEQLNTQVSVLKSRLACPVCHYRDKACIITKCGHLHCKQCVEERISNRSRKCPTCNQMFSRTDVTDVFLE